MQQNTRSSKLWEHEVLTLCALHWFQDASWLIDVLTLCLMFLMKSKNRKKSIDDNRNL